jgi:hypothetical protein
MGSESCSRRDSTEPEFFSVSHRFRFYKGSFINICKGFLRFNSKILSVKMSLFIFRQSSYIVIFMEFVMFNSKSLRVQLSLFIMLKMFLKI